MKLTNRLLTLGILVLALGACSSGDISETETGGVLLSISHVVGSAIEGFSKILDIRNLAGVFGWQI